MKKFTIWPGVILSVLLLSASIFLTSSLREDTNAFKKEKTEIAKLLDFNDRLLNVTEAIPMFGDWVWEGKATEYADRLAKADVRYESAVQKSYLLFAIAIIVLGLFIIFYLKSNIWFGLSLGTLTLAIVFLVAGLFSPMLEMEAYKENLAIKLEVDAVDLLTKAKSIGDNSIVKGLGLNEYVTDGLDVVKDWLPSDIMSFEKTYPDRMYFFYQNKGIFDLVNVLWNNGNLPIAIIIGLFSIIVPIIKLLASLYMILFPVKNMKRSRKFLSYVTKFSMLDVFVASLFVTYFSFSQMSTGIDTDSTVLIGMYFFTAYVVFALISGIFIDKLIKSRIEKA